jgi:dynein heavy chain
MTLAGNGTHRHLPHIDVFALMWLCGSTLFASLQEELRRANYVTPKNYLDFINNYKRALGSNRKQLDETAGRLSGGLQKLVQAATEVDAMQKELSQAKVVVETATRECNELLEVSGRGVGVFDRLLAGH